MVELNVETLKNSDLKTEEISSTQQSSQASTRNQANQRWDQSNINSHSRQIVAIPILVAEAQRSGAAFL